MFVIEVIFFAIFSQGTFVTPGNITNILRQVSYYGIASVGMTFVILIGGIDLSIGSIITLVNMVCAYMMVNMNMHWTISVLAVRGIDPNDPRFGGDLEGHIRANYDAWCGLGETILL